MTTDPYGPAAIPASLVSPSLRVDIVAGRLAEPDQDHGARKRRRSWWVPGHASSASVW